MDEAQLVVRAQLGEREAFAEVYDRYAALVFTYCRFDRSDEAAALATAATFALFARGQRRWLDDPSRLKPWLLGLAQSVLRRGWDGRQVASIGELPDLALAKEAPELAVRRVLEAAAWGLERDDQELLAVYLLEVAGQLTRAELARVRGLTRDGAAARVARLRERLHQAIVAVAVACQGRQVCPKLGRIVSERHGLISPTLCKRVVRHARRCGRCGPCRAQIAPWELLAALPPVAPPPVGLRRRVLIHMQLAVPPSSPRPKHMETTGRQQLVRITAAVAFAAAASLMLWLPGGARPGPLAALGSASGAQPAGRAPLTAAPHTVQVHGPGVAAAGGMSRRNITATATAELALPGALPSGGSPPPNAPAGPAAATGLGPSQGGGPTVGHRARPSPPRGHGHGHANANANGHSHGNAGANGHSNSKPGGHGRS